MNRIWKVLIATAIAGAMVTSVFAQGTGAGPKGGQGGVNSGKPGQQGRPGGMRMGGRRFQDEVFAKLNLNADQKAKIKALQDKFRKEMEAMRSKGTAGGPPSQADRDKMMAKFKAHNDALMKILTPAQKTKFEQLMKEMREKARSQRGGPGAPPPGKKPGGGGKPPL